MPDPVESPVVQAMRYLAGLGRPPAPTGGPVTYPTTGDRPDPLSVLMDAIKGVVGFDANSTGRMNPDGNSAPMSSPNAYAQMLSAMLPVVGGLKLAGKGEQAAQDVKTGIRAYHGSPHDFDQFSLSKIGTGEGAQAYGHGLYFAQNEKTALDYRNRLTDATAPVTDVLFRGQSMQRGTPEEHAAKLLSESGAGRREMLAWAKRTAQEAATGKDLGMEDIGKKAGMTGAEYYQRLHDFMAQASKRDIVVKRGRMYEVSIGADPGQMLDLDKPLNQQPPSVKAALQKAGLDKEYKANMSDYGSPMESRGAGRGKNFVAYLEHSERKAGATAEQASVKASERLRSLGIPGSQYLDAGSRGAARGTRNFVIFDDSLIDILKKYGVALPVIEGLRRKATANGGRLPASDVEGVM